MKNQAKQNRNLLKQAGASLTEFSLILGIIALIAVPAVAGFGTTVRDTFQNFDGGGTWETNDRCVHPPGPHIGSETPCSAPEE